MFTRFLSLSRPLPRTSPSPLFPSRTLSSTTTTLNLSRAAPLGTTLLTPSSLSSSPFSSPSPSPSPSLAGGRWLTAAKSRKRRERREFDATQAVTKLDKERLEQVHLLVSLSAEGNTTEARELLNKGVNVNGVNNDKRSALHLAASEGHLDTVKLLVERGADVNAVDRFGATPLRDSFSARRAEIATYLRRHGAYLGDNTEGVVQELCDAAASGNLILLESVLENSHIKLNEKRDYDLRTPLHIAAASGQMEAVKLLLSKGADPKMKDRFGNYPADDADREGFSLIGDFLRSHTQFSSVEGPGDNVPPEELANHYNTVKSYLMQHRLYSEKVITEELDWYYHNLGFPSFYFRRFPPEQAYRHVEAFIAAKQVAFANGTPENISINGVDSPDGKVYICPDDTESILRVEEEIESLQAKWRQQGQFLSLFQFKSTGAAIPDGNQRLSLYIVDKAKFPSTISPTETSFEKIASPTFSNWRRQGVVDRMELIMKEAVSKIAPVFHILPNKDGLTHVMLAHRRDSFNFPIHETTQILKANGVDTFRKVIEQFANGITIHSMYFQPSQDEFLRRVLNDLSLMMIAKYEDAIMPLYLEGKLNASEYALMGAMKTFAYYFMAHQDEDLEFLLNGLQDEPEKLIRLENLRKSLRQESVSSTRLGQIMVENYEIMKDIVRLFHQKFSPDCYDSEGSDSAETYNEKEWEKEYQHVLSTIRKTADSDQAREILEHFLSINKVCAKTNFFKVPKTALSFRLDLSKMKKDDNYPSVPYGVFLMCGNDFHGFHVRFNDVARGGIRLVFSRDKPAFSQNEETAYFENYNLAHTQNRKNKDIPEFGSKGVLLLHPSSAQTNQRYAGSQAFKKYISSMLDVIISNDEVNDYFGKEELIFCGPDENTADYMEWAAYYAKRRGYRYWKAFTTGKPQSLGGIPHDTYGMTTNSVHQFVLETLKDHGLKEENVTKFQTGGPDGDLGSNEVLISKDKTIGIVDGSGVLCDPQGIHREELEKLARERHMIEHFDDSKLSPEGFKVLVSDNDITLPDGTDVTSGLTFRNEFHLSEYSSADLFVPCGGRPEAVNQKNVHRLLNKDGTPRFKYIVEGANLFFTPEARSMLESKGVVLFKDASSNKGGVTSSSLEVLASLAFNDEEHQEHMCVEGGEHIPPFYQEYVQEVQRRIRENAVLEYHCLMREHRESGQHIHVLTDLLSDKINDLHALINRSDLYSDAELRQKVMMESIPIQLQRQIPGGLEEILNRLPENYVRTVFCTHLASLFVYQYGLRAGDFAFFDFMDKYKTTPAKIVE